MTATARGFALRHLAWLLLAVGFLGADLPYAFLRKSEWQAVYVDAAAHFRAGESLYRPGEAYVYPPFMAFSALPFTYVSPLASRLAWVLYDGVALAVCAACVWRLGGGGALPNGDSPRREWAVVALGFGCGCYYILDTFAHQQTDVVIAAFVFAGLLQLRDGRDLAAGALLGVAAACKCTPLLFAPYLLWRGRFAACFVLLATAVGVNLLPDLLHRPASGSWLVEWWRLFIAPQFDPNYEAGKWFSGILYNQSLAGALNRWTQETWTWQPAGIAFAPSDAAWSPVLVKRLLQAAKLALLVATAAAVWHRPFRRADSRREALEAGLLLVLMLLLSPMSSKPHFVVLLLPGFCLARAAVESPGLPRRVLLGAGIVLGLIANKELTRAHLYPLAMWYGAIGVSAVVLGVGCAIEMRAKRSVAATPVERRRAA